MSSAHAPRADRLAGCVDEAGLDCLIVGDLVRPADSSREAMADLFWLTGFNGTSGLALIGAERRAFVTDFRYLERAAPVSAAGFDLVRAERELIGALGELASGRVGFDPARTSFEQWQRLGEALGPGAELVAAPELVAACRRRKDEPEVEAIAAAAELSDVVYAELEGDGLEGRAEREVAVWIETRLRELGASGPAFPPIVAAGRGGSLPHAEPGDHVIARGELVVVDLGAVGDGYCSDCTRTYAAAAEPSDEEAEVYALVLAAQSAALDAIGAGAGGRDLDAVARAVIGDGGRADQFGHGLGHGVGIEVHEPPRLSTRSDDELAAGDVVTLEPGVYVPGRFGVRIEDLVLVTDAGHRNLSSRPKELRAI